LWLISYDSMYSDRELEIFRKDEVSLCEEKIFLEYALLKHSQIKITSTILRMYFISPIL